MSRREPLPWIHEPPPPGSWRSIFKWGDPGTFKHPNARLCDLMRRTFGLDEAAFREPRRPGLAPVAFPEPPGLPEGVLAAFRAVLGEGGVETGAYARLRAGTGKTMLDLLRLREGLAVDLPAAVLHPRNHHEVRRILEICAREGIPATPRGGGSSVTLGLACPRGGVTLDLTRHMHKVLALSEADQTVTVEAGMYGPHLEAVLNAAPELFGTKHRYTCGHFPQSFEWSTVGGWAVTRGAGQNSTYYGKIEDLVAAQTFAAPAGDLRTRAWPRAALGPDLDQLLLGGEGAFGVLTEVTLRIFRHLPETRRRYAYLFPDWEAACGAAREVLQGEDGRPSVFRLSDAEETDIALKLYGVEHPVLDTLLALKGLKPGRRCLLLGTADGEDGQTRVTAAAVARAARAAGALSLSGLVTRAWEHGRFKDPYLREDLQDAGILTDTLECSVTWSNLAQVHRRVREAVHARPRTLCMAHMSHAYPQGGNLYFIFITAMEDIASYLAYQASILDAIRASGASLSHHHGIGRMTAPWLEGQLGSTAMDLLRALKAHLDPGGIMNPGGTLGLDLPGAARR
ncbi:FAD-binding oxidoreductase [Mesoterricola sediminis]|uniref:Oxidoreductase n=1 Tax=Mesoterricola sediminis TaxID=2927980 RepID=A0AA48HC03_9BACT|nr:FAD-binding oxidoreductase [Mesoterricola sediminis]BDU75513.1 oxidoreductase [Mesoterricola sediminis]